MTYGYSCDADDCDDLSDRAVGTFHLDLDALPPQQGVELALLLTDEGYDVLSDAEWAAAMSALNGHANLDSLELGTVELHFGANHSLVILNDFGIIDVPKEPGEVTEDVNEQV